MRKRRMKNLPHLIFSLALVGLAASAQDLVVPDLEEIPYPSVTLGATTDDNPWLAADLTLQDVTAPTVDVDGLSTGMTALVAGEDQGTWGQVPTMEDPDVPIIPMACKCCGDTDLHVEMVTEMQDLPGEGYYGVCVRHLTCSYSVSVDCGYSGDHGGGSCIESRMQSIWGVHYEWLGPGYEPAHSALQWVTQEGHTYPTGSIAAGTLAGISEGPPMSQTLIDCAWGSIFTGHCAMVNRRLYEPRYLQQYKVRVPTRIPTPVTHPETICSHGHWQSKPCADTTPGGDCTQTVQYFDPATGETTTKLVNVPCP